MALKITTLSEAIDDSGLKCLVMGEPGTGKTMLSATTGKNTMIINAEGGLLSLQDIPEEISKHITVATIESIEELDQLYEMLSQDNPFDWIILDSISEIAEVCLSNEKANNADGRAAYGNLADIIYKLLRKFRNMKYTHVMMTCKMQLVEVSPGVNRFGPLMPGRQLTQGVAYLFDEVFAARIVQDEEGEQHYVLQTSGDVKYACKDRSGKLDFLEPPNLENILHKSGKAETKEEMEKKDIAKDVDEIDKT